jgi:hypothetical protein
VTSGEDRLQFAELVERARCLVKEQDRRSSAGIRIVKLTERRRRIPEQTRVCAIRLCVRFLGRQGDHLS